MDLTLKPSSSSTLDYAKSDKYEAKLCAKIRSQLLFPTDPIQFCESTPENQEGFVSRALGSFVYLPQHIIRQWSIAKHYSPSSATISSSAVDMKLPPKKGEPEMKTPLQNYMEDIVLHPTRKEIIKVDLNSRNTANKNESKSKKQRRKPKSEKIGGKKVKQSNFNKAAREPRMSRSAPTGISKGLLGLQANTAPSPSKVAGAGLTVSDGKIIPSLFVKSLGALEEDVSFVSCQTKANVEQNTRFFHQT